MTRNLSKLSAKRRKSVYGVKKATCTTQYRFYYRTLRAVCTCFTPNDGNRHKISDDSKNSVEKWSVFFSLLLLCFVWMRHGVVRVYFCGATASSNLIRNVDEWQVNAFGTRARCRHSKSLTPAHCRHSRRLIFGLNWGDVVWFTFTSHFWFETFKEEDEEKNIQTNYTRFVHQVRE